MNDFDRLDHLLEERANLLNATTGLLEGATGLGRSFTEREQDAWDWAQGKIDKLGEQIQALMVSLTERGYGRRLQVARY